MKPILVAALAIMATSSFALGQVKDRKVASKEEREVRQLLDQLREAQIKNDVATLQGIYADDYMLTEDDGLVFTKVQRIAAIGSLKFESSRLDDVKVRIYSDAAVVTARATVQFRSPPTGPFQFQVTMVCVKMRGRWQLVASHESFIRQPVSK